MIERDTLTQYLNDLLFPHLFKDYAPNGLQVAGKSKIKKMVTGVSANQALLDAAIQADADAILVHHGYFWKNENPCVVGYKRERLKTLLTHNLNLYGYHLPLDAHNEFGNNVQLAKKLDFIVEGEVPHGMTPSLIKWGRLNTPMSALAVQQHLSKALERPAIMIVNDSEKIIRTIAWCTGAAQDFIESAAEFGVDAYLTGEVSERTHAVALELGVTFFSAGHHATERYGVWALGQHLAEKFGIDVEFIDINNPI